MNRKAKGAVAVGAGAILLLGGLGSYALWSDTAAGGAGTIETGDLALSCPVGSWTDISYATGDLTVTPASDSMVPGDVWKYSGNCTVTLVGKNLTAELSVSGITGTPSQYISIDTQVGEGGPLNQPVAVTNGQVIPVNVIVTFAHNTPDREFIDSPVSVSGMKIDLKQTRQAPPPGP